MLHPVACPGNGQFRRDVRYRTDPATLDGKSVFEAEKDRRVRRTKTAVHRALISLMLERGYDKVTVSAIIDRADIGRSTFYAHFAGKEQVLYDGLDDLAGVVAKGDPGPFGFSLPLLRHVAGRRRVLRALLGRKGHPIVRDRVTHLLTTLVAADVPAHTGHAARTAGITGAYMAILTHWLDEDDPGTPEDLDRAFREVVGRPATGHRGPDGGP